MEGGKKKEEEEKKAGGGLAASEDLHKGELGFRVDLAGFGNAFYKVWMCSALVSSSGAALTGFILGRSGDNAGNRDPG